MLCSPRCLLAARRFADELNKTACRVFPEITCGGSVANNILIKVAMSTEAKKMKTGVQKIGTHSGNFHCDEALACFMLQQLDQYKDAEIIRTRDIDTLNGCDIVVDVGDIFDPERKRFDHHQKSFQETLSSLRPELGNKYNIRLSSAGLVYTFFGEEAIKNILKSRKIELPPKSLHSIYRKIYENFIEEIDAIDNGVPICDGEPKYKITTGISARVGYFNPPWNHDGTLKENEQFEKAKSYVGAELVDKILHYATVWLPARDIVSDALNKAKEIHESLSIMELSSGCPWKEHLFDLEQEREILGQTKYVLFKDVKPNDWRVMCVPIKPDSFICRKFLHKDWRGIRAEELRKASGVEDANFCHVTGFIGGATSREGVYQMAVKSLNGDYVD